ncbi:alpha/beta fold hydrolase [Cryobacterium fucosi]|uniref:Alpha/beta fold hydrolase n=1 Tax=Cryobacterium fucosi TaxID=1259157 RepID=A0A4R9AZ91_9MICO|nr:alpha/beta fold hydrolase [Cryobacterium fucosi]TFD72122.1 alpha/beta fold hydrolase [Cryobacterium fucosi]
MTSAPSSTTGYHTFHPDVSINYQLNRFSDGSPTSVAELTAAARRIDGYPDYTRELLSLSDAAAATGRTLAGALYQRSAEFYMLPGDPRKDTARQRFIAGMRAVFGVDGAGRDLVPYRGGHLYAHRSTPPDALGTVVMFGGFDSYLEELFAAQAHFVSAGYDTVVFEGPGQGSVLEEMRLPMTPDWGPVVGAVLDHYQLTDVTVMGYSLGGGLAIRAAAVEPRIRRVICDDILTDFAEVTLRQVRPATRRALALLLTLRARGAVNRMTASAMRHSLVADWGLRQGMHTTGTTTAYDFLRGTARYETATVSGALTQDVLLLAGSDDHYVPRSQLAEQLDSLTAARSVTARLFTAAEGAANHVHVGNTELSLQVMTSWLSGLDLRGRSWARR